MYVKLNFKHKWKSVSWMNLPSEIEHLCLMCLWVEADALLTEALEGEGDQTWHIPLF